MKKTEGVYNPLITDFSVKYDVAGTGSPETFTVLARDTAYFSPVIARHVKKHLTDRILHTRGIKNNPELDKQKILEEISV